jgi:hypothetical protein
MAPDSGQADIAAHRALSGPERARSVDRGQFLSVRLAEPDAHGGPEQPGEHVAVHEGAEVAEHRLDLDFRVLGDKRPEELPVFLAGLGYLHRGLLPG